MSRKIKILLALLALIGAAACAFLAWRVYDISQKETVHRIIAEAWDRSGSEDMPEYLTYIDLYSDFGIEKIEKGDPWVVTVRVMGVDLGAELKKEDLSAFSAGTEEWEMDVWLVELVKRADLVWVDCIVYLYPEDEGYRVRFSETFVDAMSGMLLTYGREMAGKAAGGGNG